MRRLLVVLTLALPAFSCRVIDEGWPRGYAIVDGTISRADGSPWLGEIRLRYGGRVTTASTNGAGSYHVALEPAFPEGVPDTALTLRVDPLYPGAVVFLDSTVVLFARSPADQRVYRLDIRAQP